MSIFLGLVGIVFSVSLVIYRERVAEMIGAGEWMEYVGGVYNFVILVAVFVFFFSVASLTGTLDIFLTPIRYLLPTPSPDTTLDMP
ncbi:MAG TPA: hypothetical protein DDX11_02930 [Candidatus Peribacter riflensis]|uniref:Uncharacterized protein n=1 Tax=Candidatus Peribacter riflensis TaxID=1735162 RepID=A0A0S1SC04_9BACT|nr:MAG: hypothetical protein PeribacterA2_0723 [Candidatus Peribacter riflensis]OGJ77777.1 MAG: hypothetical protein A2398_00695 [Candidatus Peribacteria bacterium RIFOXYB1_FULL_57_12]ALM11192.1 MAG: hypothetical protein PeribacterB2_0724 [Candidatus Peribacter riflensis]ALM12295.1 MAG: hypothetical protein PeribacterC2_0724 [Candidatus Peribacter riflensis]ALM13397.1 MAG: hypothetical protein PeribacterD1_0724 [Candidatus Peribacter riflensis]